MSNISKVQYFQLRSCYLCSTSLENSAAISGADVYADYEIIVGLYTCGPAHK